MIGTALSHFRILAMIGEGGMGVVCRAEGERRRPLLGVATVTDGPMTIVLNWSSELKRRVAGGKE